MDNNRIVSLIYSPFDGDRMLAMEAMRNITYHQILGILYDQYRFEGQLWRWRKDQPRNGYKQENAFYYDIGFGFLAYNGYNWYCERNMKEVLHTAGYKLRE